MSAEYRLSSWQRRAAKEQAGWLAFFGGLQRGRASTKSHQQSKIKKVLATGVRDRCTRQSVCEQRPARGGFQKRRGVGGNGWLGGLSVTHLCIIKGFDGLHLREEHLGHSAGGRAVLEGWLVGDAIRRGEKVARLPPHDRAKEGNLDATLLQGDCGISLSGGFG